MKDLKSGQWKTTELVLGTRNDSPVHYMKILRILMFVII